MKYAAMKKLLDLSLDTMSGVFPFLKYDLQESNDGTELTVAFSLVRMDGFSAESYKEVVVAFKEDTARFLRIPLESEKKFMSFGYDSLIQLFVFIVSFFSIYLGISIKQVLNFFFNKEMNWQEFLRFVLDSNLIDTSQDMGAVFIYGIGVLEFRKHSFLWTDMHYNQFSYKIKSDVEALFVISFVLGYVQSVLGHDLLVSNLVEPEEPTEEQTAPGTDEAAGDIEGGEMAGDPGMGDMGGPGAGPPGGGMGDLGDLGDLGGEEGLDGAAPGDEGLEGDLPPEDEEPVEVPGGLK